MTSIEPSERRAKTLLLVAFVALLLLELPGSWLYDPDESRYAEIPREMLATGDFVTPRLNGLPYLEKPPLLYWTEAASLKVLGPTPYAARVPARLAALATAAALALACRRAMPAGTGAWAALAFLSAPLSWALGRVNIIDGLLTFALTLAFLALRAFVLARERDERARGALALLGLGCGLAMLAKGLIGVVLPGLVLLAWAAVTGRWRRVLEAVLSPAPVVFAIVAAPWFIVVERATPGFSQFFFVHEHFMRYATASAARPGPVYYFVPVLVFGLLPWTLPLALGAAQALPVRWAELRRRHDDVFLLAWLIVLVGFFSVSKSKLVPYVLPAVPAAALLAARVVVASRERTSRAWRVLVLAHAGGVTLLVVAVLAPALATGWLDARHVAGPAVVGAGILFIGSWVAAVRSRRPAPGLPGFTAMLAGWMAFPIAVVLALPRVAAEQSGHDLALAAARTGAAEVACYRSFLHSVPLVLERPVPVAGYVGELDSGGRHDAPLLWSLDEFWRRWESDERLAAVVPRKHLADFVRDGRRAPRIAAESSNFAVVTNFTPDTR